MGRVKQREEEKEDEAIRRRKRDGRRGQGRMKKGGKREECKGQGSGWVISHLSSALRSSVFAFSLLRKVSLGRARATVLFWDRKGRGEKKKI